MNLILLILKQITDLFNASEILIRRSKNLNEQFGKNRQDIDTVKYGSEELFQYSRLLIKQIKDIKDNNP